jgi:hypothetical protein
VSLAARSALRALEGGRTHGPRQSAGGGREEDLPEPASSACNRSPEREGRTSLFTMLFVLPSTSAMHCALFQYRRLTSHPPALSQLGASTSHRRRRRPWRRRQLRTR